MFLLSFLRVSISRFERFMFNSRVLNGFVFKFRVLNSLVFECRVLNDFVLECSVLNSFVNAVCPIRSGIRFHSRLSTDRIVI
jgi:hypothetical protein